LLGIRTRGLHHRSRPVWQSQLGTYPSGPRYAVKRTDRRNKYLAIPHPARPCNFDQLADNLFDPGVVYPESDLDLREKRLRVFTLAVLTQIALLSAEAFDLTYVQSLQRRTMKAFDDLLSKVRLDDGNDLFHVDLRRALAKKVLAKHIHLWHRFYLYIAVHLRLAGETHRILMTNEGHRRHRIGYRGVLELQLFKGCHLVDILRARSDENTAGATQSETTAVQHFPSVGRERVNTFTHTTNHVIHIDSRLQRFRAKIRAGGNLDLFVLFHKFDGRHDYTVLL